MKYLRLAGVSLFLLSFVILVMIGFLGRSIAVSEIDLTTGSQKVVGSEVNFNDITLNDTKRSKPLELRIYYPVTSSKPSPVIVFSHGLGGSREVGLDLMKHWARSGYVVICPTHADSIELKKREYPEEVKTTRDDFERAAVLKMLWQVAKAPQDWENRAMDVNLIINSLSELSEMAPELAGKMDTTTIGVGGHSYGAFTTMLISGVDVTPPDNYQLADVVNSKPIAFLVLSGQGVGRLGLDENSWSGIDRPLMVMTGSLDDAAGGKDVQSRTDPFHYSSVGDKYLLFIEDAMHGAFTGALASNDKKQHNPTRWVQWALSVDRTRMGDSVQVDFLKQQLIFEDVKTFSLAFWDKYLKQVNENWLTSDAALDALDGESYFVRK